MNKYFRDNRKINPTEISLKLESKNNENKIEIGPTKLAISEWEKLNLKLPNLSKMREYRWNRLVQHINEREYAGLLLFDPLNIRYATDSTNMQIWNMHNPFRAVLVLSLIHI